MSAIDLGRLGRGRRARWGSSGCILGAGAGAAALLALGSGAHHPQALGPVLLISLGVLVLCGVCGDGLAVALVPPAWRSVRPLLALVFGLTGSGLVLMAFGVARVPLAVSLWLTLALGVAGSVFVRRRRRGGRDAEAWPGAQSRPAAAGGFAWPASGVWMAILALVFLVALLPAFRTGDLTIYGENPDASQVVGIAVLFQHVAPTATDPRLPLDVVPPEWRFRYPIFYPLAAVANLVHADPIRVFPVEAALLVMLVALGWGLVGVRVFGAPGWSGPVMSGLIGLTWIVQYLAWHPYWNQLWGTALMPFGLLFGFDALAHRRRTSAVACLLLLLMLWFAYPLALPYPVVLLAGGVVAYWRRPRRPHISGWRGLLGAIVLLALLTPAVVGSVLKLKEAIAQVLSAHSALWGGDITRYVSPSRFAGTGGGLVGAGCVLAAGAYGVWRLPRRRRAVFGVGVAALLLLDLRFRLAASGPYMDFKHLCFVGLIVLSLAFAGLLGRVEVPGRARWLAVGALVLWSGAALWLDHQDVQIENAQVTPQMFQIRQWAAEIPPLASVRVDIPTWVGGMQLWAVYMLGAHPVDSFEPVTRTTYATAQPGFRADYSLALSTNPVTGRPVAPQLFAVNPPIAKNASFALRRIRWPARYDDVPQTASEMLAGD